MVGKWEEDTGIEEDKWEGIWENVHSNFLNQKNSKFCEGDTAQELYVCLFCENSI